ncbi:MAG: DDE-type integrase/transposase/recombinase [Moraxellaceae bacterium]|nr:DDE-type integrase/transposase/recombinase [Moraxellaceae bacterium]
MDITRLAVPQGDFLRGVVAVVIDLFSRQVVGWAMDNHMKTSLCVSALQMAFWRRKACSGLLHHSDRGGQYASKVP